MNGVLALVLGVAAGLTAHHFTGSTWANAATSFAVAYVIRSFR